MMAAEVIRDFRRHGGNGIVDGQALNLTATQPPPVDLLNELRTHKAELLTYLNAEADNTKAEPDRACSNCGSGQCWQLLGQAWHCRNCTPDIPLTATTLTFLMP